MARAAIDRGLTLPEVTDDWDGERRPRGAGTDIGADELSGTMVGLRLAEPWRALGQSTE
jgi:hypothetical protein